MTATTRRDSQTMVLSDNRQLGFAEWGSHGGERTVVDLHGGPGCRLSVSGDVGVIADSGLRWVTVDRPGLGLSWPSPGRKVADFAKDVTQLADHLGVDQFDVVGWSMGGPYAAACGALSGERVRSVTLLAPAPVTTSGTTGAEEMGKAFAWILARDDPWQMCQLYTALALEARRDPQLALQLFAGSGDGLTETERAVMDRPDVQETFVQMIVEATAQGAAGLVEDMRVELTDWGFNPADVRSPISLWQGDQDSFVDVASAYRWAETVPDLELRIMPNEGHLFPFGWTEQLIVALSDYGPTNKDS